MTTTTSLLHPDFLLLCRPEFTETLIEECRDKTTGAAELTSPAPGLILARCAGGPPAEPMVFERQRLIAPEFFPSDSLKPITPETAARVLGPLVAATPLWTLHAISLEEEMEGGNEATSLPKRLEGIWNTVVRLGRKSAPDLEKRMRPPHRLKSGGIVVQALMLRDGLWISREQIHTMVQHRPGGESRMKWDDAAPSRSYLKMEEAIDQMPVDPVAGERVIDLGAAPGGWTYSFIKRGCDVIAVDHGPMKLPPHQDGWGSVEHRRENGITFEAPRDWPHVDWLVGDMLIAPGVALGLLRRWLEPGKARRLVLNIKLPQEHPYAAIQPVEKLLREQSAFAFRIRQLYHDRREVTVMAWR